MSDLLQSARSAQRRAYAPYSRFLVGCAIRGASGAVYLGANVENAAYPQGHCAERSAVSAMIMAGETRISEIAVVGSGEQPCAPCGGCRQLLSEFAAIDAPVQMGGQGQVVRKTRLGDLLPMSFGPADMPDQHRAADPLDDIRDAARSLAPRLGIILGSGLAPVVDLIEDARTFDLAGVAGVPPAAVEGHSRLLRLGRIAGLAVACLEGRAHLYEGSAKAPIALVRLLKDLGCERLLATSAVGGIRDDLGAGTILVIDDHLNLTGSNPLTGPNDDAYGPRFPDMTTAYDAPMRAALDQAAADAGIALAHGVYAGWMGPSFETPAEIRMMRGLGADVVGMSTVAEAIGAAHAGLPFAALSIVVNRAAGLEAGKLTHAETLAQGRKAAPRVAALIRTYCARLA